MLWFVRKQYANGNYEVVNAEGRHPLSMSIQALREFRRKEHVLGVTDDEVVVYDSFEDCCKTQMLLFSMCNTADMEIQFADKGMCGISKWNGTADFVSFPEFATAVFPLGVFKTARSIVMHDDISYIEQRSFRDCKQLEDVVLSKSLEKLPYLCFAGAEYHSDKPFVVPENIVEVGTQCFQWFTAKQVDFEGPVKLYTSVFEHAFVDVVLFQHPDAHVEIECFKGSGLRTVGLPENLQVIPRGIFMNCEKLKGVRIPSSVRRIEASAFSGCVSLQLISMPEKLFTIEKSAFQGCNALQTVIMQDSVREIDDYAFQHTTALKKIKLSKQIRWIGKDAFSGSGLEEFVFPEYMESIGDRVLADCKNLRSVTFPRYVTSMGADVIAREDMRGLQIKVYRDSLPCQLLQQEYGAEGIEIIG